MRKNSFQSTKNLTKVAKNMLMQLLQVLLALTNNSNIGRYAAVQENVIGDYVMPNYTKNFRRHIDSQNKSLTYNFDDVRTVSVSNTGCKTYLIRFGINELVMSSTPKGVCKRCCQIKHNRDVLFALYNKKHPTKGVLIMPLLKTGAARKAGVNSAYPTVIFLHGFTETSPGFSGRAIIDAYLSRNENYNIILINWSELTSFPWYTEAVQNVKLVANILKQFLEFYNDSGEIPIDNVHLIGFSLGAQISSFVGKTLRSDLRLKRITGLDPAFPNFPLKDVTKRLTYTDAEFVDVIHTDSGVLGFPMSVGHTDFYPNGGRALQPGCQPSYLVQIRLAEQIIACSHVRAWQLYAESVRNPKAFPATKCSVWRGQNRKCDFKVDSYLGFGANKNSTGKFYLFTKHKKPFAMSAVDQMY